MRRQHLAMSDKVKKTLTLIFLITSLATMSAAIPLDNGWNTVSVGESITADTLLSGNNCELDTYQDEYIWKYDNSVDDWSHPSTVSPEDAFYLYSHNDCNLDLESGSTDIEQLNLDAGWKMLGVDYNDLQIIQTQCETVDHLEGGDFSFLLGGEWYHPILSGSNVDNRGYWIYLDESCNIDLTEEGEDQISGQPVEENYLEISEASIVTSNVSPDESNLIIDFSLDRESAVSNDVTADLGLHLDEESDPIEIFEITDSTDQELTLDWETLWNRFESGEEDISAQLVLNKRIEGDYRWNQSSIDAGTFNVERCSNFESNIDASEWDYDYNPEETSSCLDKISMDSTSNDNEYEFNIISNEGGVCGEVELDSTYSDNEGNEVITIELDELQDSSNFRETELKIRQFEGGPDANWNVLLEEDLSDVEDEEIFAEFVETSEDDTHDYNKVQITLDNDYCSGEELEVSGSISYEEFPEDGPGTCKPDETWCGSQTGGGECIDEDNYDPGLCY